MAATFWLIAECVRPTDRASSAIVIGPRAFSRMISITQLGLRPLMPFSAYMRAISSSMPDSSRNTWRHRLCSVGSRQTAGSGIASALTAPL